MQKIRLGRSLVFFAVAVLLAFMVSGCGSLRPRRPVPENLVRQAQIPGMEDVRVMPDVRFPKSYQADLGEAQKAAAKFTPCCKKKLTLLALSGGGDGGAFGAGLLNGWTEAGNRPDFDYVTGISTGALIAPLAFIGKQYDPFLKKAYTTIGPRDIARNRHLFQILQIRDAVSDSTPLARLIARDFGERELALVAQEHASGRRLFIGTTDFDAQLPVFWNMGAIAASGHPKALEIIRKVMLASASIPVVFPPVYFNVEAEGKSYDEMHLDGGVVTQVFGAKLLADGAQVWREAGYQVEAQLFMIRNSQLGGNWEKVQPKISSIASRAISTLIKTQGLGDIYRAYVFSKDSDIDFNVAGIPLEFHAEHPEEFNTDYMKALYKFSYEQAREGYEWRKRPPHAGSSDK
jgi:predicted acylesterase/phospholipase RssA